WVGRTGGASGTSVEARRKHPAIAGAQLNTLLCRRLPVDHLSAIIRANFGSPEESKGSQHPEHIEGYVVAVRPDTQLGIVIKISIRTELIAIVCAGRIRGLRDGDALVVSARERELSHHPSVCGLIVLDYRITIITGFTRSAEPAPQSVPRCRTVDHVAGGFIKHSERQVDPLYVLRGTYRAVGVRWSYVDVVTGEPFADSFEIKSRSDSDVDSRSCE